MTPTLRRTLIPLLVLALLASSLACGKKKKDVFSEESMLTIEQLWDKGMKAFKKGHTATARRYFDQINLREDAGDYKDRADIAIADSFYDEKTVESYSEAIGRYQSFLSFHPTHPQAAYCQYRIGLCHLSMVETPDRDVTPALNAREAFRNLVENYPESEYAAPSQQKLVQVNDILAAHEIKVGDYYLKNEHYSGAAARYRLVVENYPAYWNMPLVHFRLAEALAGDGQDQEAAAYYILVSEKAPGTELAATAQKRLARLQSGDDSRRHKKDLPDDPLLKPKEKEKGGSPWWKFWDRDKNGAE